MTPTQQSQAGTTALHPYIATEEVITALAQLGEDPTVANAESIRARLDVTAIVAAADRAAAIRDAIIHASLDDSSPSPATRAPYPDAGSNLTFEANPSGETPWKLDTLTDTIARLTAADGRSLAVIWCNRSDTSLEIEYAEVRADARRCGVYSRLLKQLSEHYNVYSDLARNNAAAHAYHALGALEMRDGRMLLRKRPAATLELDTPAL
ncbi:hypothetical protein [Burkholderia ubonensis]|uniref:hypothetical protein n=1 Tax=Burkholderia ubonensis TaxID=101571 RepID=UPI00075B0BA4|nr:hypothetical protein [Burkholderia ubonensis]KVV07424.1 hypothetical protein WK77_16690 [Burkholderia ubonensis]